MSENQSAGTAATTNESASAAPTEAAAQSTEIPRKYKVNAEGQVVEVDEQELLSGYGLRKTSMRRMEEAANARRQAEAIVDYVLKHPDDPRLKEYGFDFDKVAEDYVAKKYGRQQMDPRE